MSIDLRMTFSYRHFRKIHFSGGGIPIGGSPSKTIEFLMTVLHHWRISVQTCTYKRNWRRCAWTVILLWGL